VSLLLVAALVAHVLLPFSLFVQLWLGHLETAAWLGTFFFLASYLAFLYVAGSWSWFGFGARPVLPALLIPTAVLTWPGRHHGAPGSVMTLAPQGVLGAVFLRLLFGALRGRRAPAGTLDLAFPLRGGTFVVGQGGATAVVNYHHRHPGQRYALDILALGAWGTRAHGLHPRDPERYAIWGAEVVSPCDGTVAAAVDGLPDHSPPSRDPTHPPGNHVAIRAQGAIVYLAHKRSRPRGRRGSRRTAGRARGQFGQYDRASSSRPRRVAERGWSADHVRG
jgi:hypothetical protein